MTVFPLYTAYTCICLHSIHVLAYLPTSHVAEVLITQGENSRTLSHQLAVRDIIVIRDRGEHISEDLWGPLH